MSFKGMMLKATKAFGIEYSESLPIAITQSSTETSGTVRSQNVVITNSANSMSKIIEGMRVSIGSEYYTGDWINAIVGRIDYGDDGDARGGMAAAICAEMNMPAKSYASIGGPCYSLDCEFNCPTGFVAGDRVTYPIAFINFGLWGGAKAQFDDEGYIFHTDGLTAGSGNVLSANGRTLRVNIEGADKYLCLSDTEDDFGAMALDTMIINTGRIATGTLAGTAVDLGATYAYGSGMYLRYNITDWTGIGSSFYGAWIRAQTGASASGKTLFGLETYATAEHTCGQLIGNSTFAYLKGAGTKTVGPVYGATIELTFDASQGTQTITTEAMPLRAKITGGNVDTFTKIHGFQIIAGDMDGQDRTYGNAIEIKDDAAMGGTITWTKAIHINSACTKGIVFDNAGCSRAIDIQITPTTADRQLYMDIDYGANEKEAAYIISSSAKPSGEITAVRARGQAKAESGSTAEVRGVHAQGIAYDALYGGTVNAIYAEAIAKGTSTVVTIRGAMVSCDSENTPTSITNMMGAHIRIKSSVAPGTLFIGTRIETEKIGSGVKATSLLDFKTSTWTNAETAVGAIIDMSNVVGKCDCHIRFGTAHTANETTTEGDFWYDAANHVLQYYDNAGVKTITAT